MSEELLHNRIVKNFVIRVTLKHPLGEAVIQQATVRPLDQAGERKSDNHVMV